MVLMCCRVAWITFFNGPINGYYGHIHKKLRQGFARVVIFCFLKFSFEATGVRLMRSQLFIGLKRLNKALEILPQGWIARAWASSAGIMFGLVF
ncbi:hypothetical protein [Limnohabitans sp. T6-5]|uniref:hypothetical protein n=1 Tax=Limnohabitans sp. T6-5 TaxID=1100724 RepID=UPI001E40813C|nr:hypothetical protein [Limnohabitans sp. T6-5]